LKAAKNGIKSGYQYAKGKVSKLFKKRLNKIDNVIPDGKMANHLFKGAGKLANTPANRALIQKISNGKPVGVDPYGKSWYTGVDASGNQIYAYAQNGIIKGAGYMNMTAKEMISKFGLKK